jgi:hypothetical protein
MNTELCHFYETIYPEVIASLAPFEDVSDPMFCCLPDGYLDTTIRLMIVGQQTRGWGEEPGLDCASAYMEHHRKFDLARTYRARSSPFWRGAHELAGLVNPNGPERAFLWSNLVKVDQDGVRPSPEIENLISQFGMVPREIEIAQPDAVVFFTGPNYDERLIATLPEIQFEFQTDYVARLVHPVLPRSSFRTYHPKALQMQSAWRAIADIATLIHNDRNG